MKKKNITNQQSLEKKAGYLDWTPEEYLGNAYVSDTETYELLYANPITLETLGHASLSQVKGRKCYEVIQGRTSPCPFCTNDRICEEEFYEWEFYNPTLKRTFMIKNRAVGWEGHRTRLELSHDNYNMEYKPVKKDRGREAILRTTLGDSVRVDARDTRSIFWYDGTFLDLIGYTSEQFEDEPHSTCGYLHLDDLERVSDIMGDSGETGRSMNLEARTVTRDDSVRILMVTFSYASAIESWDGTPSLYSIGIDVTRERSEQARQRKALEEAYQTARAANVVKINPLSVTSHDIRTPTNAIVGTSMIAQANLDSPDRLDGCLNKINTSSRYLLSLINEVPDMSKTESGKIDLNLGQVNLPTMPDSVMDICGPLVEEKHQQFQVVISQVNHGNMIVDGDRLQQVLVSILSNVVKYTQEEGSIQLCISELYSPTPKKSQHEFICIDNGIDISREFMFYIFESFSRAGDPCISQIQGTGLGMAITENIVRMMNGIIEVDGELDYGSRFIVTISLEPCREEASISNDLVSLPVLVMDDDKIICESVTALSNELGMRGYWVPSGKEAIKNLTKVHRDKDDFFVVILDWKMSEMDGLETLRVIQARLGKNVPIIIVSAYDYSEIEEESLHAGADAFITKPLSKSKMLQVLQLFVSIELPKTEGNVPEEGEHHPFCGKRILLAEDNDANREIVIELPQIQNMVMDPVENGKRVLEAFKASAPGDYSMILMDIQMPMMNGYDAATAIRSLKRADVKTVPICALTTDALATSATRARSVGMNDHIPKPINMKHFYDIPLKWMS